MNSAIVNLLVINQGQRGEGKVVGSETEESESTDKSNQTQWYWLLFINVEIYRVCRVIDISDSFSVEIYRAASRGVSQPFFSRTSRLHPETS
jgi:hypothetical protein